MEANVAAISHRRPWKGRALAALAFAALAAHAAHTGLGLGRPELDVFFDQWLYNGLMLGAALACLLRGVVRPGDRAAWLLLGAGALAWSGGDIYYSLFLADMPEPPLPSVSDALFLSFYPAAYAALALLVRRNVREFHASLWVDALLGALAVSAVATALLYDAVRVGIFGEGIEVATLLGYPVGDVLLLALVIGLFALSGWRPGSTWSIIGLALALAAAGDAVYLYQTSVGTYTEGTILDTVWPASLLLLAVAAWRRPSFREAPLGGLRILALPALFAGTAMALFISDMVHPLNPLALGLACGTMGAVILRMAVTLSENLRMVAASRGEALTDALTGLGNRRKLVADLQGEVAAATQDAPRILILFDLDGFKRYNDSFGHLAGDALLARLGHKLAAAVRPYGEAYRLGGDEFCVVLSVVPRRLEALLEQAADALRDSGEGFEVESSYGAVALPHEADSAPLALQIADQRMYARKERRSSPVRLQTRDVLMRALHARQPELRGDVHATADLAIAVGRRLGMESEELDEVARAAELHDVGKVAVPDAILAKPDDLSEEEWAFMRRHPVLGERILNGAAAMRPVARIVRSTHERWDGSGYPDGLAGDRIPLGARIVAVCTAFAAMTSDRPYRPRHEAAGAVRELRRAAGTQFDPTVVDAFVAELEDRGREAEGEAPDDRRAYVQEVAGQLREVLDQEGERV
ncbi:MAG TPA: HD domain-containing phosphohydrolase [Solirubrobacteraceae bacterium]|nr:HD domain-containing phosphohydrolase [Solirubrobacteraceae bacterium]